MSRRDWDRVELVPAVREESLSPEAAALLIARDARPTLDVNAQLALLDELAAPLDGLGAEGGTPREQAAALAAHLHEAVGFHGNEEAYYDARNSYLDEVVRRRKGIPITLSVVYAAVGRRAGVAVDGIGFPGHFLARVGGEDGVLIDPFHGGSIVGPGKLREMARRTLGSAERLRPEHLAPVGLRPLVARMLANLKRVHEQANDHARAMVVSDRLFDLTEGETFRRDRGLHALALGALAQARDDLEGYLEDPAVQDQERAAILTLLGRATGGEKPS